ncbi:MAG: ABC transporter ATP-binding protein [Bacteroidota bacterium]
MTAIEIEGLQKRFGGIKAVEDFSFSLPEGAIYGIIGPNGAGKTTIFNVISGIYRPDSGRVRLFGRDITGWQQHRVAVAGIGRTFQNIRLFRGLTVAENVLIAMDPNAPYSFWESLLPTPRKLMAERRSKAEARAYLGLLGLEDYAEMKPEGLPYGLRRRLEIARALAIGPRVLLLDEPAAGLNPKEIEDLNDLILNLNRDRSLSIILIEHRMEVVMRLCQRIYVQNFGRTLAVGSPAEIQANEEVIKAYLGDEE